MIARQRSLKHVLSWRMFWWSRGNNQQQNLYYCPANMNTNMSGFSSVFNNCIFSGSIDLKTLQPDSLRRLNRLIRLFSIFYYLMRVILSLWIVLYKFASFSFSQNPGEIQEVTVTIVRVHCVNSECLIHAKPLFRMLRRTSASTS